jgi:regulator of replication initiation timing/Zn finger protein HypA/HybF involved in hydrogenase expression
MEIDETEILTELKEQHVSEVKNIMTRVNGELKRSPLHVLTFDIAALPEYIFVGFIRVPVRLHVPNPLRCLTCQKFGHVQTICQKPFVCPNCGKSDAHVDKPCDQEASCLNCGGSHPVWSRQCPAWKREKKILEIKAKEKLSFVEARKRYNLLTPSFTKSFASVAATPVAKPVPEEGPSQSDMQKLMQTMTLLLAGQQETKTKLDEQAKRIEEQSKKIDEQTEQIKLLRKENEILKLKNENLEVELSGLRTKGQKTKKGDADLSASKTPLGSQESLASQTEGDRMETCDSGHAVTEKEQRVVKKQRITLDGKPTSIKR